MTAALFSDFWFVFSMTCLAAAVLGTGRWLMLTRPPAADSRCGECNCRWCFACEGDRRII